MASVLAAVLGLDHVPLDGNFFDDLGADSLAMARFCARLRKRSDLPTVSMTDIYRHPSIRALSTALADTAVPPGVLAVQQGFGEVLAGIVGEDHLAADAHFFDDLGADSLGMARFCARVRKRSDLPTVSMTDVYAHPTLRTLAAALAEVPTPLPEPAPVPGEEPSRASTRQYLVCGLLQLVIFVGLSFVYAAVPTEAYLWISGASALVDIYLRSVLVAVVASVTLCVLPIAAKWVLVGRWRPQEIQVWSLGYVRFWLAKILVRSNPLVFLMVGSPLYSLYLRALGAQVGRGVTILSKTVPVCTDLLTIGDGAIIRKDVSFTCYRAYAGRIQTGRVTIGRDVLVGEKSVLDISTSLGDGAQLGHASSLNAGQSVPTGERWHGSPAVPTQVDYATVEGVAGGGARRVGFAVSQLLSWILVYLPVVLGGAVILSDVPRLVALFDARHLEHVSRRLFLDALSASLVLLVVTVVVGLLLVTTVPRLLALAITPGRVYPLYGWRYVVHLSIVRFTNVKFFTYLFGDSSYIVGYLRGLGYDLSTVEQTGSNFGTGVVHESPYLSSIGSGTMVADGLSIMNADYSSSSFRVSRTTIGAHNFLGNHISYPSQGKTGDNCLLATKVMVPIEGPVRTDVGLLGSPSFEIPRSVQRDLSLEVLDADERRRLLRAKNRHNLVTIGLALLVRWVHLFVLMLLALVTVDLYRRYALVATAGEVFVSLLFTVSYFVLVERLANGFRPLRPQSCSIYDRTFWRHERYWKLAMPHADAMLIGTPFKNLVTRALGLRLGRRVFDDGCFQPERTLVTIGDDCTLNAGSVVQCHSQEDGAFKSDHTTIGAGATLGVGSLVHYGVTVGAGAVLAPDSFLMKGEEVPDRAYWEGNPARAATAPAYDHDDRSDLMTVLAETSRDFWRSELLTSSFAPVPRWCADPRPGVAEHLLVVPDELHRGVSWLAAELAIDPSAVLLAAHTVVLCALTGEADVTTGHAGAGVVPLPCRLSTRPPTWRELLLAAARAESQLLAHADFPLAELRHELGLTEPSFDVVFDPADTGGPDAELPDGVVLAVGLLPSEEHLTLRLRYRTDVLDADHAGRVAGYHRRALELAVADPAAEHGPQSLLSAEELSLQLEGFAGRRRELPDRRAHELFADRARREPQAVAAVFGDQQLTYGALNARANRLARALVARGVGREDVVAVVTERNLDWVTAVLAVFKAGAAYLPVEPHFPPDRVATMLGRAGCRLALTEPGSSSALDAAVGALPGLQTMVVADAADEEGAPYGDLDVPVTPDQLAYIYFTSGSTGKPKGAMCEHAGLLNHLYAKIDDLEIGPDQVVAQTAPQCFDISLWQLVAGLLVGARTLLVEQEVVLDVERFVETIVAGRVNVLQVVPSYLEAVLSYLEQHPRPLPDLRYVSVTGEAVKKELTQRWFAAQPGIRLVNAYGLTETSDDTNHEVMDRVPDGDLVPLGRPVNNVSVFVVDEHLNPVPLGAPGAIVFSGVCVGRGYVNDPERTRSAFLDDPHRPGQRLYQAGDFGRWLPGGKLEFLGRQDRQVKINGFRIEIGEIDNALLGVPGVRDAAVVAADRGGQGKHLVAFYSGPGRIEPEILQHRLARSLPAYMVPAVFCWLEQLPLTANGKVDVRRLTTLAAADAPEEHADPPRTPAERRVARGWSQVLGLGVDQLGRHDHFFDRGGSSLAAVKLAIALDRSVSLADITRHPVLADLAALLDSKPTSHTTSDISS